MRIKKNSILYLLMFFFMIITNIFSIIGMISLILIVLKFKHIDELVIIKKKNILITFFILIIMILINQKIYYPLEGPDEIHYFYNLKYYRNELLKLLDFFIIEFKKDTLLTTAYASFGIFYIPFYKIFNLKNPGSAIFFNLLFFLLYINMLMKIIAMKIKNKMTLNVIYTCLMLEATSVHYLVTFNKDIFSNYITILSLYLFFKEKKLLSIIILFYAILVRPYAIVVFIIYYFLYIKNKNRTLIIVLLLSSLIIMKKIGIIGIFNSLIAVLLFFIMPLPFRYSNYITNPIETCQSLILIIFSLVILYRLFFKKLKSKDIIMSLIGILIYSQAMIMLGFNLFNSKKLAYGLGSMGDNFVRKKMPIVPIIIIFIVEILINKKVKIKGMVKFEKNQKINKR